MALCARKLGAENGRELFKGSKDTASPPVCTRKKIFCLGYGLFVSDVISRGFLGHLGPGLKPFDGSISLKFFIGN